MKKETQYRVFIWEDTMKSEFHTEKSFREKYSKEKNPELYDDDCFCYDKESKNITDDIFNNWNDDYEGIRNYDNMKVINLNLDL